MWYFSLKVGRSDLLLWEVVTLFVGHILMKFQGSRVYGYQDMSVYGRTDGRTDGRTNTKRATKSR